MLRHGALLSEIGFSHPLSVNSFATFSSASVRSPALRISPVNCVRGQLNGTGLIIDESDV